MEGATDVCVLFLGSIRNFCSFKKKESDSSVALNLFNFQQQLNVNLLTYSKTEIEKMALMEEDVLIDYQ